MDKTQYTFRFKPLQLRLIMESNLLNDRGHEKQILDLLVKGYSCLEIGEQVGYSRRTIQRRRQSIYEKTKDLMC